jgi:hypothetical protein
MSLLRASAIDLVSSLIPGSGPLADRLDSALQAEWERNRSTALKVAEKVSGLSREDLAVRVVAEPRLVPLLTRLAYTAGMTGRDELLQTLGAAFGHAASNHDDIDACEAILTGAATLQPQDLRVLSVLRDGPVLTGRATDDMRGTEDLADEISLSPSHIEASLARLQAAGLARGYHGVFGGGSSYEVNEDGEVLCDLLTELKA